MDLHICTRRADQKRGIFASVRLAATMGDMGANSYSIVQGDTVPEMDITMTAQLPLLVGAQAVELDYVLPDGTSNLVALVVVDAPTGALKRTWVSGDTDQIGLYAGRVKITTASGAIGHWPDDDSRVCWTVRAR